MTKSQKSRRLRPLLSGALLRSQTDERLAALASAGNEQAFGVIYERYGRELGSHAERIVRGDRADDVVQQAMLTAWNALLAGTEISDLRAWLHRVTHNAALDMISRRGYNDAEIPVSSIASSCTEDLAEGRLSAASALAALAALPEGQRQALTLTAIEGRSGRGAALQMGISESPMRQLVYRARCSVRSAAAAVIPLPLINWLIVAAEAPATPAAISLSAAGGGAATIAKIAAVIGVTAATVGVTHPFQRHHPSRPTRNVPTTQTTTTIADGAAASPKPPAGQLPIRAQPASRSDLATGRPGGGRGQTSSQTGQSQQGFGNHAGRQGRSGSAGDAGTNQQTATAASTGIQQSGTQQQFAATQNNPAAPNSTNNGPQPQQNNQTSTGTSAGQSGASPLPPAFPTGPAGGQNQ